MLDQSKTGKFILSIRKEKGITQRQLADNIGVSDKAISRWETGRGMPDTAIMPDLCRVLDITVNELLSGERLSDEAYSRKAEDNMVELIKDSEKLKEDSKGAVTGLVMGVILLALFIIAIIVMSNGLLSLAWFIDLPSILAVLGILFVLLGASGQFVNFFRSFKLICASRKYTPEELASYVKKSEYALDLGRKGTLLGGVVASLIGFVSFMGHYSDPSTIGPSLAVVVLTLFYSAILSLIILLIKGLVHKKG